MDLIKTRLINQQILHPVFTSVKDVVSWMGAMQAQDFSMAGWAAGSRLNKSNENLIFKAINNAEIIRTHLLRPTWHFVSSGDIYWMIELTAPRIFGSLKSRHKELGITDSVIKKSNSVIKNILKNKEYLTREEIVLNLRKRKIQTDENRASHLLISAELSGIICSGKIKDNKHTYSLLNRRVKKTGSVKKEEALARLAEKYFQSHGPASLQDFVWWSGLTVKDAKVALESISSKLFSKNLNSTVYYFMSISLTENKITKVFLLPAYDEYIISYKDRGILMSSEYAKKIISSNGLFRPVVLINGIPSGIWSRLIKHEKVSVHIKLFKSPNKKEKELIEEAAIKYGEYLGKTPEVSYQE